MSSNIVTQTSLWGKQLGFRSILPISLQQIKYEKIHAVHSNELAQGYKLRPVSFYIDQYRGKHFKTPRFFTNFPDSAHLWNLRGSDWRIFCSILAISLQPIAYEKIHALHSNELSEGYTFISITIFIDKYLRRDIVKLVLFRELVEFQRFLGVLCF